MVKKLFAFIGIVMAILIPSAHAFDIPLLTWERGHVQQVVLGGGASSTSWKVQLDGNGIAPLVFNASLPNKAGYIVYSLNIPKNLPLGAYSISTVGVGSPRTVVAGVALVETQSSTATTGTLLDLTKILSMFIFLTALLSALRARKYSSIAFESTQVHFEAGESILTEGSFLARLVQAPYRIRVDGLLELRTSLLRFLLIREGELLHRLSKKAYGYSPLCGAMVGVIAAIETLRNAGIEKTPIAIFLVIAIGAVVDPFAAIFATASFWAVQLFTGNVASIRDVLVMLSVGLSWFGPAMIGALVKSAVEKDFAKSSDDNSLLPKVLGVIAASLTGALTFYLGQALIDSVLYTSTLGRSFPAYLLLLLAGSIALRGFVEVKVLKRISDASSHTENFYVARVSSPRSALIMTGVVFAFLYIWTSRPLSSLLTAILFSLPYFILFIQFGPNLARMRLPRNVLAESILVSFIALMAYRQITLQPLLQDQRAALLLTVCSIPGLLHSLYSAICSRSDEGEIIKS